jgi:hypothetical protein
MIFIIKALSHVRKKIKGRPKKTNKTMREKERRGNVTILFFHTSASK